MTNSFRDFPSTETTRLMLRPLALRDAGAVHAITGDPVVGASIALFSPPFTLADTEALLARWDGQDDIMIGAWLRADGALAGSVALHLREGGETEVGYWFGAAFHGRGYATEAVRAVVAVACRHLPYRRVFAEVRPENVGSWRVLEKCGFRATGEDGARPGRKRLALS